MWIHSKFKLYGWESHRVEFFSEWVCVCERMSERERESEWAWTAEKWSVIVACVLEMKIIRSSAVEDDEDRCDFSQKEMK